MTIPNLLSALLGGLVIALVDYVLVGRKIQHETKRLNAKAAEIREEVKIFNNPNYEKILQEGNHQISAEEAHQITQKIFKKISPQDIISRRHWFICNYCQKKGWDRQSLSLKQILEIRQQEGWKNPK